LERGNPAIYEQYRAETSSTFLNLPSTKVFGLDGQKIAAARAAGSAATAEQRTALEADQQGDRSTLRADSFIPATMAGIYLILLLYFASIGGYKRVEMSS
jgi:DHA2 family metal-tetracycline-proton antiporter-like MFS transporter